MEKKHIPLWLTLFRLVISPLIFPFLIYLFLPANLFAFNIALAILFLVIGFTDFLDGYYARLIGHETTLGKMLDPIADKVFIASVLIALVAINKFWFFWAILLIGRELFIGGLRQVASEHNVIVHVSWLGKIKTAVQIIMVAWVIANPARILSFAAAPWWNYGELCLIIASVVFSYWSARSYYTIFKHELSL